MNSNYLSGFLQVTVLGGEISPIKGALVTVYSGEEEGGNIIASEYTDNSGSTLPIPIFAYNVDYNAPSSGEKEVKRETIEVSANGYYKAVRQNIPIFPGIVTREYVYLIPLSVKDGQNTTGYDTVIRGSVNEDSFPGGTDDES